MLSFDYPIFEREDQRGCGGADEDEEDGETFEVLVAKDSIGKATFAHAVSQKGPTTDGYAVKCILEDLRWPGYSHVVLKSDNEKAILNLLKRALVERRVQTIEDEGGRWSSKRNTHLRTINAQTVMWRMLSETSQESSALLSCARKRA